MTELSLYGPGVLLAYAAVLLSMLSPGPNVLAIMGTSMGDGRASGVALAMGVASGSFLWSILTVSGLSALLVSYAAALTVIKIVGGLFLLWLAWKSFKSAASPHDLDVHRVSENNETWTTYYLRGLTVQMTNPKAALAWIAITSLGLSEGAPLWVPVALVVGTIVLSVTMHLLYALVFSTAPMVRIYAKGRRWIQGTMGVFFAFAGVKLLTTRT